jgi:hypothetical protein
MEIEGYRWQDLERMAQNRTRWRTVVSSLCTTKVQQASASKQVSKATAQIEQVQDKKKTVTGRRRNTIKTSYVSIL